MSRTRGTERTIAGRHALSVGDAGMPAPDGWEWVKLTDIARLESGHTPSRSHSEYWDGDISWIGIPDARAHHGGVIHGTRQTVTQAGIDNSAARVLPAGTVCLSRTASVGYVTVMGRPMATSQDFVNWVCSEAIDPHFLKQLLVAEGDQLRKFGEGSTHTTIYFPEVEAFRICVPGIAEQHRIVAKLEDLLARSRRAKAALDAIPPLLDKLRQSVLAAAFRGDLTSGWREKNPDVEPAEKLLARIRIERRNKWEEAELAKMKAKGKAPGDDRWKDKYVEPEPVDASGLPELPEGWCWASLAELTSRITDGTHQPPATVPSGVPFIGIRNVIDGRIDWESVDKWVTRETHQALTAASPPEVGDILYTAVGATYGRAIALVDARPFVFQRHIALFKLVPAFRAQYAQYALNSPGVFAQAKLLARGAAQPTVTLGDMARFAIPLAPTAEQHAIEQAVLRAISAGETVLLQVRSAAERQREVDRALLAKAFRGDLVPQDPTDEPAAAMLARLRAPASPAEPSPTKRRARAPAT